MTNDRKRRCAVVGTGVRAISFIDAMVGPWREHAELVAFVDPSAQRMRWHNERIARLHGAARARCYAPQDFDQMVREARPDVVIVTSVDATHHLYIVRAMELGCDVISEKPMTTDAPKAQGIFDAIERTGRSLRVGFNYRYPPHCTAMKQLMMSGVIGTPTAVHFSWMLDTSHGADYFRRWHASKANSSGLLVHKSTHHFDLVNWWLNARPREVFAMGGLRFYGKANAEARGEARPYERYTGEPAAKDDPFALDLAANEELRGLYLDAEQDSGYIRDRNVFGEHVDIEDTMAVMTRYDNGVVLNYALVAYSPWEGFRVAITGTKGRVELYDKHGAHVVARPGDDPAAVEAARAPAQRLEVFPMFGVPYVVDVPQAEGGHGGGDPLLMEQLFSPAPPVDPYGRAADHVAGAASLLVGICANESMATGRVVRCDEVMALG